MLIKLLISAIFYSYNLLNQIEYEVAVLQSKGPSTIKFRPN